MSSDCWDHMLALLVALLSGIWPIRSSHLQGALYCLLLDYQQITIETCEILRTTVIWRARYAW